MEVGIVDPTLLSPARLVVIAPRDTGHVDGVADPAAATLDVAFAAALSAVVVIGGDAYQGSGDLVAHLAELRHPCNEVCGARLGEAPAHSR